MVFPLHPSSGWYSHDWLTGGSVTSKHPASLISVQSMFLYVYIQCVLLRPGGTLVRNFHFLYNQNQYLSKGMVNGDWKFLCHEVYTQNNCFPISTTVRFKNSFCWIAYSLMTSKSNSIFHFLLKVTFQLLRLIPAHFVQINPQRSTYT